MPFISQHTAFGLNTDDDPALLPPGDYRWLKNGRVGKSQQGHAGAVENILGMFRYPFTAPGLKMKGWKYNKELNEIYAFGWHNSYTAIYLIKDGAISQMVSNPNLGIPDNRLLWSIAIVGDDLVWTSGEGEIRRVNIATAKAGGYDSATEEDIILLRRGPRMAPIATFMTGGTHPSNLLGKSVYQFAYRYVYKNNQYSVLSPWSKSIYSISEDTGVYFEVEIPTGINNSSEAIPNNVEYYEWLVKRDEGTEWQIIDRTQALLPITTGTTIDYTGEVLGITLNNNDAFKLVDAIPRDVVALEFMKNRLFLANYLTGYNQEQGIGVLYQTVTGDFRIGTASDKVGFGSSSSVGLYLQYYDKHGRPGGGLLGETVSTPRLLKEGDVPYVYLLDWTINAQNITPPDWAYTYQVLRTDNQRKSFFLHALYMDAYFLFEEEDGTRIWGKDYAQDTTGKKTAWDYLMLDITRLNINEIGYTHSEGDRVEFWLQDNYYDKPIEFVDGRFIAIKAFYVEPSFVLAHRELERFQIYSPSGVEQETTIHETGENYDILNPGEANRSFSAISGTISNGDTYYIDREDGYWEGEFEGIYSDSDPYANAWVRIDITGSSGKQSMNPFNENYQIWAKGLGRTSVPYVHPGEQVSGVTVRFSEERIPDSKINNTNKFNILDRYDKIGDERTPILKLTRARNVMVANHQRNATSLYVNEGFVKTVEGSEFLAKSSGVITDDRELVGSYGCIPETIMDFEGRMWWVDPDQGTVVRYTVNGTQSISDKGYKVERFMKDLITQYIAQNEDLLNRDRTVPYAGYDPEFKEYFITFPKDDVTIEVDTMVFSEETQRWVGEYEYDDGVRPDIYMRTNYKAQGHVSGSLYEFHSKESSGYNYFFGAHHMRVLSLIVNPEPKTMKVWNNVWLTKLEIGGYGANPVIVLTNKYGQEAHIYTGDFINDEGILKAPIWFDRNTENMSSDIAHTNGDRMRSEWIQLDISSKLVTLDPHVLTQVMWKQSEFTR